MILASANQKGCVLKTTSAQNIGVGLCLRGKKVLLVDIDPQASLTIAMGYEPEGYKRNVCSLMMGEPAGFCIHRGDEKRPDLIPGSIQLAALEMQGAQLGHNATVRRPTTPDAHKTGNSNQ